MRAPGCGRLVLPLLLLTAAALAEGDAKGLKEGETPGNFMEDEQWLSSISQYSGKIKHWNRFRDVSPQGRPGRGPGLRVRGVSSRICGSGSRTSQPKAPQPGRLITRRVNSMGGSQPGAPPLSLWPWPAALGPPSPGTLSPTPARHSGGALSGVASAGREREGVRGRGNPGSGCCWTPTRSPAALCQPPPGLS